MAIRVGINGFGRIGRTLFRAWLDQTKHAGIMRMSPKIEIVAINEPVKDKKQIADILHLLEYDSVHGRQNFRQLEAHDDHIMVDGRKISFYTERDPAQIGWDNDKVDVVIDCTGVFKDKAGLGKHLRPNSVKKVIMSAPGDNLDKTIVVGVNDHEYDPDQHHIVSNASCTTNCLAPIVKVIDEAFGISSGLVLTVHSYTADQSLIERLHDDLRRARAATMNMIPTKTGAAKAVGEVIPHLKGKLDGYAIRVPTPNVSFLDVTFKLKKDTTKEEVNKVLTEASKKMPHILGVSTKELVSLDFNGDPRSSIIDEKYTNVIDGNLVKIASWYDNETGYSNRLLDLVKILMD